MMPAQPTDQQPIATTRPRLLLVDDDQHVRRIIALGLKLEGYEVGQAADGQEALEKLREHGVAAVILDLMMPVMDGRAFIQKAREELGSTVPILMLTSFDRANATRDLLDGGASGILHKPVKVSEIVKILRELMK